MWKNTDKFPVIVNEVYFISLPLIFRKTHNVGLSCSKTILYKKYTQRLTDFRVVFIHPRAKVSGPNWFLDTEIGLLILTSGNPQRKASGEKVHQRSRQDPLRLSWFIFTSGAQRCSSHEGVSMITNCSVATKLHTQEAVTLSVN